MANYDDIIKGITQPSFNAFYEKAKLELRNFAASKRDEIFMQLERGIAQLSTHEQLCQYLYSYGNMHQAKLLDAFKMVPDEWFSSPFEVVDWGCGQAMGSINLLDHLREINHLDSIERIVLIEPSARAIERGTVHLEAYRSICNFEVVSHACLFEDIHPEQIQTTKRRRRIHIFSNILDVAAIDLRHLARLLADSQQSDDLLVCVGPFYANNRRMDRLFDFFEESNLRHLYAEEKSRFRPGKKWTFKARITELKHQSESALKKINFYPPVQFSAAYELDVVREMRLSGALKAGPQLEKFEVFAPFDLGGHIYDDVQPRLAVLNNIISRGVPTKSSPELERYFSSAFGWTEQRDDNNVIEFEATDALDLDAFDLEDATAQFKADASTLPSDGIACQFLLTPIAVARMHKILVEAIISGKLDTDKPKWDLLIEEKDVPFGHIGLQDFLSTWEALSELTEPDSHPLNLPSIQLHVVNATAFHGSPLHLGLPVLVEADDELDYDLVLTQSMLSDDVDQLDEFSRYGSESGCYFNLCSASASRSSRKFYTSDTIQYRGLTIQDDQGRIQELEGIQKPLEYFLQLLFRKKSFRSGQIPILHRALRNEAVIGLLPTGGGKSLTYQLAALLQPGITIVIDPLKSLMKDQFEGLLDNGIDGAVFINSSLDSATKRRNERKMESSEALFVFLSPERLSMSSFRRRLHNMHSYNVYFSYGVIDEVHCVSEWGHDFRFSYLHLGRNLYNYVQGKNKPISLFGLTATASFDVLADVERELSGSGKFPLDADVIVRHENTNRLELQFKVEMVPVAFQEDAYYDKNKRLPQHLPKAINITNHWPQFDSKGAFVARYVREDVRGYVEEAQQRNHVEAMAARFAERQASEDGADLDITLPAHTPYFEEGESFENAGIIFCPHVQKTGLSVREVEKRAKAIGIPEVASYSGKHSDQEANENLSKFRKNKSPLMVATKAFGMGMDKPNVRFTVNMNYSSSLESFVQEAGRAGRDRKLAVSSILISDYNLVQISRSYPGYDFPIGIIKTKWFHATDLDTILDHFNIVIDEQHLVRATPSQDVVKLHCAIDNKMFAYKNCNAGCPEFQRCELRKAVDESRGWMSEKELLSSIARQGLKLGRKHFQYLNADYQTMMFFFNSSFKGDFEEKQYMFKLLSVLPMTVQAEDSTSQNEATGFLDELLSVQPGTRLSLTIPFSPADEEDLQKAIYRMTCIGLVDDFTYDFDGQFKAVSIRKAKGGYFEGLRQFLLRYFTNDRAELEITRAANLPVRAPESEPIRQEIYQCLAYLTEFIYEKISEKRKRALDDMRDFCMEGVRGGGTWLEKNEHLKDFLYYYFNSKYAKADYVADNGEPFSLLVDTEEGKYSHHSIVHKYMRVIDDDITGIGTPLDNIKHLYGAVRLIRRSLTDSNPTLDLLDTFCISYMGVKTNQNLRNQQELRYWEGMIEFSERMADEREFWNLFDTFNQSMARFIESHELERLRGQTQVLIHARRLHQIKTKYLRTSE